MTSAEEPRSDAGTARGQSVSKAARIVAWYKGLALFCFNIFVVILLLNFVFGLQRWSTQILGLSPNDPISESLGERVFAAYPGMSPEQVRALLRETWSRTLGYQSFTPFRERAHSGVYVNVHEAGFRVIPGAGAQGPWPLPPVGEQYTIFLLGGSTTFGYGVADDQTIATHLQAALNAPGSLASKLGKPVRVYNFGTGFYYSSQERILLQQLLLQGAAPDRVVFIDGLNEFAADNVVDHAWGAPTKELMDSVNRPAMFHFGKWFAQTPLGRAAGRAIKPPKVVNPSEPKPLTPQEQAKRSWDRYVMNTRLSAALCAGLKIDCTFVWQPVPQFGYELKNHLFAENLASGFVGIEDGYALSQTQSARAGEGVDRLDLAGLQQGVSENLYVDRVHYTGAMNKRIAQRIAEHLTAGTGGSAR